MKQKTAVDANALTNLAIEGLKDKKGTNIIRMDLRKVNGAITDFFVICTGTSDRHVKALAESVEEDIRKQINEKPYIREGVQAGEWVLLDYVNVVVHIFLQEKREFYNIEGLWADAKTERFQSEFSS